MQKITWLDYLYSNKPQELMSVISSFGLPLPHDYNELYECVDYLLDQKGVEAEKQLMKIHPEYDSIREMIKDESGTENRFHNFSGEMSLLKNEMTNSMESLKIRSEIANLKRNQNILLVTVGFLLYHTLLNTKK